MTTTKLAGENRKALLELTAERVSGGDPLWLEALLRPVTSQGKLLRDMTDYLTGSELITIDRFESADTIQLFGDMQQLALRMARSLLTVGMELGLDCIVHQRYAHLLKILDELQERAAQLEAHYARKFFDKTDIPAH